MHGSNILHKRGAAAFDSMNDFKKVFNDKEKVFENLVKVTIFKSYILGLCSL